MPLLDLYQACTPRESVYEQRNWDTVYNIDDLAHIHPRDFFAENYITEGMRVLLTEAFKRLEGRTASAAGAFLLSQSMGGGKTHNLVALALLAKFPEWRSRVMLPFYEPGPLGAVRVVSFSGRKTNTPFGIWGEIAEQLDRRDVLKDCYTPLRAPGPEEWVALLRGEPRLILLDELPPYLEQARGTSVGATTLDTLTTAAMANLLIAVNDGKLPNVCLVLTDLSGTAYNMGAAAMSQALNNLQQEVNRQVVRIDPVRLNTNELYHILRTRLFERMPADLDVEAVAEAYRQEIDKAQLMSITAASPEQLKAEIRDAYPFHPAIRDLYARFKENTGFQQTRALIRIMRLAVADLWNSGAARSRYLIGAHDFDLHGSNLLSEIRQINPTLEVAVAHDIAADSRGSVAEVLDATREGAPDAQDACKLIFLSSLSTAVNPTLGLDRFEVVRYLAAPGRDLTGLPQALDQLQTAAWYLHETVDHKLLFRNTENLVAKMESYVQGNLLEQREEELRRRMEALFKPALRVCYQSVRALPPLDEVQEDLTQDTTMLVIFRPSAAAVNQIKEFWEHQSYKNRLLFLTGSPSHYGTVLQRAAELNAIRAIIDELKREGRPETDPQFKEAQDIQTKKESSFYLACREVFQTLYYPERRGLVQLDLANLQYGANKFEGETQLMNALKEAYKYEDDVSPDTFRPKVERRLWLEAKEVLWSEVKRRAAADAAWVMHHPRALDDLKAELVRRDIWRESGGYVERGPFPKPAASVSVQQLSRNPDTGEAVLRVKPLHGDTVYWSESDPATTASPRWDTARDQPVQAVRLWFLGVDSTGEHAIGESVEWTNTITVKHRFYQDGDLRRCELRAIPGGALRFTTDGSGPETAGQPYTEPLALPENCRFVQAIAEYDGVKSSVAKFDVPAARRTGEKPGVMIDSQRPAVWRRRHQRDDTHGSFTLLELAKKYGVQLGGVRLQVMHGDKDWVDLHTSPDLLRSAEAVLADATRLKEMIPNGNLDLEVEVTKFAAGRDLLDLVRDLKTEIKDDEVTQ